MLINFSEFVEFKNSKGSQKALKKKATEGLSLRFNKIKAGDHFGVSTTFSPGLIKCMELNNLKKFKMLINQKTNDIILLFDNSTKCIDLDNYTLFPQGKTITNKFITYTMLPIIGNAKSAKYTCEYNDSLKCMLCTPVK